MKYIFVAVLFLFTVTEANALVCGAGPYRAGCVGGVHPGYGYGVHPGYYGGYHGGVGGYGGYGYHGGGAVYHRPGGATVIRRY